MGGPSFQEGRSPDETSQAAVGDRCPTCTVGRLCPVDENYISCDECGFDVPIKQPKEEDGDS